MKNRNILRFLTTIGGLISFILFMLSFAIDARLGLPLARQAQALRMSNSQYNIQSEVNPFGGKATGTAETVTLSGGQSQRLYSGTNYQVRAGFQYIYSVIPFAFSISTTDVNFGRLVPGEPITRENTLTVSNGSATGYQVTLEEDHPLRMSSANAPASPIEAGRADIPDTTCDAGTCSHTMAATWTSPLTYGFGYRCYNLSDTDCGSAFTSVDFYKQFPNAQASESPQVVMSSTRVGRKKQAKVNYKVNIPATQAVGIYQNIIKYIATPSI